MHEADSIFWFGLIMAVSAGAWLIGWRYATRFPRSCWLGLLVALALLFGWGWLVRHPATAVTFIPSRILSRVEGVGGVPFFLFMLGVGWARSHLPRQRQVMTWAMLLGVVYLVHGSRWLLQETPSAAMGQTVAPFEIRQTQDYSCVPAACATALNILDIPSTESQMAELTMTRSGSGATIVRALHGLNLRLNGLPLQARLISPPFEHIAQLPLPSLTPLQFEINQQHMVVLCDVTDDGVWMMDPQTGYCFLRHAEFRRVYRDRVIIFQKR